MSVNLNKLVYYMQLKDIGPHVADPCDSVWTKERQSPHRQFYFNGIYGAINKDNLVF